MKTTQNINNELLNNIDNKYDWNEILFILWPKSKKNKTKK
jgi:hypothetical protein